jgi:hypothetical protein
MAPVCRAQWCLVELRSIPDWVGHQDDDRDGDPAAPPAWKAVVGGPGLAVCGRCPERRGDHDRAADDDAQRPLDYAQSPSLNRALDEHPTARYEPRDLIRIAFRARPNPVPGGAFEYCNTNTVLLGMIARRSLDAQALPQLFRERLFAPLGMHDTAVPAITSSATPGAHPQGYMYATNASTVQTFKPPPQQLKRALAGTLKPRDVTDLTPS